MVVELKGQQIRIRVRSPRMFSKFRVHDVGRKGRLQRLAGYSKRTGWMTQAWRINTRDYRTLATLKKTIRSLRISKTSKARALRLAVKVMRRRLR